ncbi:MAG: cob(I)yrinic acid a,c-diamide adenosyltransferase [Pseudomonadales bacterium]|nr:cob(I)yrinic acid a,c-diamide adenosyltransferase [Pseudomonadales bacterium]
MAKDSTKKRISKVTTRAGDKGSTKLATGKTIAKSSQYVRTVGAVDELNSQLGLVLADLEEGNHVASLIAVQQDLFDIGAVLALEGNKDFEAPSFTQIEAQTTTANSQLPALTEFVLPRGSRLVSLLHVARAVCRRAEAEFWSLIDSTDPKPQGYLSCAQYLNRLSDLLFVLARYHGQDDERQWRGPSTSDDS